jgi:hypothetical protein
VWFLPHKGADAKADDPSQDHSEQPPKEDSPQAPQTLSWLCRRGHKRHTLARLDLVLMDQREVVDGVVMETLRLDLMTRSGTSINIKNTHKMTGVTATNSMVRRSNFRCIK